MRILHTSDWHLGRAFGPVSLHEHQSAFADWLVGVVQDQQVDLVVVAGDVYDRAVPPVASIELFDRTLVALRGTGAAVVVIAGNHDSPERVAVYDRLVESAGIHLRGGHERAGEVVVLPFADGPLAVVPLPYLDPALAPVADVVVDPSEAPLAPGRLRRPSHQHVVRGCLARSSAAATAAASRSLAVAHAFVVAGELWPEESESERSLALGGSAAVEVAVFDGFSYTALGHLHAPQSVGGRHDVRYSGTPLAYSFGETAAKSVVIVEMGPAGEVETELVPVPAHVGRRVATITGTIDELLASPRRDVVDRFVRARLTDAGPVLDARQRLLVAYPHVIEVELRPAVGGSVGVLAGGPSRRGLDPLEVAAGYWSDLYGDAPAEAEARLIAEALLEAQPR